MSEAVPPVDQYVFSQFILYAEIDGREVRDIVAMSANFALNSIPTASLTMACGINATTGEQASVHEFLPELKMRAPVKVFLEVITTDGKKAKMPEESKLIFEGYYAGYGFQRSANHANYTIHLVHWLDDLNAGSMLSRNWFPGAPFSLAENSSSYQVDASGDVVGRSASGIVVPQFAEGIVTQDKITADFWGLSLREALIAIAKWRPPEEGCDDYPMGSDPKSSSNFIVNTLERIISPKEALRNCVADTHVPLEFDLQDAGLDGFYLTESIRRALGNSSLASFKYSTFWSKLVGEWAPMFYFAVSPGVDFAQVIPFYAGLREPYKTIEADEYGNAAFSGNMAQIIEGIDIFWAAPMGTGMQRPEERFGGPVYFPSFCEPLGGFPLPRSARDFRGTVLVKEPPTWIQSYIEGSIAGPSSTGTAGKPPGGPEDTTTGDTEPSGGNAKKADETQREVKEGGTASVCDVFAEHWYKSEVLSQRYGELSGKLRFDIAPGSLVKIKAPTRLMDLDDNIDMFATVVRVSYMINSERAQAGTAFAITNIRTEKENQDLNLTGVKTLPGRKTPLYKQGWSGGPLSGCSGAPSGSPGGGVDGVGPGFGGLA